MVFKQTKPIFFYAFFEMFEISGAIPRGQATKNKNNKTNALSHFSIKN